MAAEAAPGTPGWRRPTETLSPCGLIHGHLTRPTLGAGIGACCVGEEGMSSAIHVVLIAQVLPASWVQV